MFFRNATVYQLLGPAQALASALQEKMQDHPWTPCGATQPVSRGFIDIAGVPYVEADGAMLFAVKVSEKKIAPRAIKELVADKVAAIEDREGRKVYRKERLTLQDEIILDLMPHTPQVSRLIHAYIDTTASLIVVDGKPAQAESLINLVRECVGSLPCITLGANLGTPDVMTGWLQRGAMPLGFDVGEACELREPGDDGGVVRCTGVDIMGDEIETHLQSGRQVHKLAMSWEGWVSFTLVDTWRLQGLKFDDDFIGQQEQDIEDADAILQADLAIQAPTLRKLLAGLGEAFGGWVEQGHLDVA
tara:strand:- start:164 stop:1072 length:909 start_codon:yes stop_codon:yes gene_type:complete